MNQDQRFGYLVNIIKLHMFAQGLFTDAWWHKVGRKLFDRHPASRGMTDSDVGDIYEELKRISSKRKHDNERKHKLTTSQLSYLEHSQKRQRL